MWIATRYFILKVKSVTFHVNRLKRNVTHIFHYFVTNKCSFFIYEFYISTSFKFSSNIVKELIQLCQKGHISTFSRIRFSVTIQHRINLYRTFYVTRPSLTTQHMVHPAIQLSSFCSRKCHFIIYFTIFSSRIKFTFAEEKKNLSLLKIFLLRTIKR